MEEVLETCIAELAQSGAESPRLDARILASSILKCEPNEILMHARAELLEHDHAALLTLVRRRCSGEPVSRILGVREFWSLQFFLSADTLDPRPDSETIIDAALKLFSESQKKAVSILDIGTGSGCLLLALLSEWKPSWGLGVDISSGAVQTAQDNAEALGLGDRARFCVSDWLGAVDGPFDLVISNPPYIRADSVPDLSPEVRTFDPMRALVGGADGLEAYRKILPDCRRVLRPGGVVIVEFGQGQHNEVESIMRAEGLTRIESHEDLSGTIRCLSAQVA